MNEYNSGYASFYILTVPCCLPKSANFPLVAFSTLEVRLGSPFGNKNTVQQLWVLDF
jgi:hypothetical protein